MKHIFKGNWFFSFILLILFSCGSQQLPQQTESTPSSTESYKPRPKEKAYVLLRSEGSDANIEQLKEILYSNFHTNNISTYIVDYPLGRPWDNNQIFTTAYNDDYDYIILIDQVAKFTIDNRTNVGGKYQIRSYPLKSSNPDWIDLGQLTCNISVKPSINKFTNQILENLVPNYKSVEQNDVALAETTSNTSYQNIQTFNNDFEKELAELKRQLEIEKQKTFEAIAEKERLEKHYSEALRKEKEKTQQTLAELEQTKVNKQKRLEEERLAEQKDLEEKKRLQELEKAKALEEKRLAKLKKEQEATALAEAKKLEEKRLAEKAALKEQQRIQEFEQTKKLEEELLMKLKKEKEALALDEAKKQKIQELKRRLEEEKIAGQKLLDEKKRAQELEMAKKQEAERLAELEKEKEALDLAEAQKLEAQENQRLEQERLAEAKKREAKRLAKLEKEKLAKTKTAKKTLVSKKTKSKNEKTKALVILKTKPDDFDNLKKLKYNIEFDFMFAKALVETQIMDKSNHLDETDLVMKNQSNYDVFIIVNQLDYQGDGNSEYQISSCNLLQDSTWKSTSKNTYNLNDSSSLKELSKSIVSNL